MPRHTRDQPYLSRRSLLKGLAAAPLLLRTSPLHGSSLLFAPPVPLPDRDLPLHVSDVRLVPHYPKKSALEEVLRLVPAGSDEYPAEGYAFAIQAALSRWSDSLRASTRDHGALIAMLDPAIRAASLQATDATVRDRHGLQVVRRTFTGGTAAGRDAFLRGIDQWLADLSRVEVAEFQITALEPISAAPLTARLEIRYDLVGMRTDGRREERVGTWRTEWTRDSPNAWKATQWEAASETVGRSTGGFVDVSGHALGSTESYTRQMLHGSDYWRTVLDGACGLDVYGNNGIAAGDFDNDGFDDLYVCQPAGLPNRLYRNRGDGTFDDVTEKAGVGVLDNTACALFADFRNSGLQDLLVVCGAGPLLFLNQGDGTFAIKRDAFHFARAPEGTFTHAAIADYDRDGRLDIYFCLYSYYLGLDQYHYPVPYFDARNGPANFLLHNEGDGRFVDRTEAAGLNAENDRYSFACAWGSSGPGGLPDLYVANDFGRANLYRNNGNGTFTPISSDAQVQKTGAGMSAAWCDYDNDGRQDIYSANMWSAAGQRVSEQKIFHEKASDEIRNLYRRHARGNSLYRNLGNGRFEEIGERAGVAMGRWSWSSDYWDFDHDGYPDLYVANGYVSAPDRSGDLASFFWRQVVGKSPDDATPSAAYERGWQALNELIRSDRSWNGYERNVMFANIGDGTFAEVSGAVGLDFSEDGRSFALADIDHDGRLEVVLKNRNAPQLRILHNTMPEIGRSIAFCLRGRQSNRDGIGTAITLEAGELRQTKYLQAGSGFLSQHAKELFFGLGTHQGTVRATVHWPSGATQTLEGLPVDHRILVEEGSPAFEANPFAVAPAGFAQPGLAPEMEALPANISTWLIEPLGAPEFSLPDAAGTAHALKDYRGRTVLLTFWSAAARASTEQLELQARNQAAFATDQVALLAICVDTAGDLDGARAYAAKQAFGFPVLFATEDVAGIYNIVYRYLFDRRRDLGLPTSFLVDGDGMIVKVYQGQAQPDQIRADMKAAPSNEAERLGRALPFAGTHYRGTFQRNEFTYGVAMFQHGYLDEAMASFRQVIAAKPDYAEGYYNLGTLSLQRHEYEEARRYLEQAVKLKPNYPEAWNNLGMIAAQAGQADEAVQDFQQSLALRPDYATALLNLGNVYRRQGDEEKAQDSLTRALALQPDDPETNYSLGMFYAQHSDLEQAAEFLQKAAALRPDYPEAINNLGVLYVREQEPQKAEQQFRACIRVRPNFDQAYLNLARLYVMQSNRQKAKDVLQELLRLQPQNTDALQAMDAVSAMQ